MQPYFTAGVYHPGAEAKGALVGFGPEHKRHHIYRALLEGLAYDMRRARAVMERRTGTPMTEMWICGGGSRSDLLMQINADVLGIATRRSACNEASGLGAAILGAVGAGLHPDIDTAVAAMAREGQRFEPNPANVALYSRLYEQVYAPMYGRLRPLYKAIQRITGYPAVV
jgi:sugar (pentulose or hexulose) kinase